VRRQLIGPGAGRRIIVPLAATQTVGYGVLYYCFSVFLSPMAQTLHATVTSVTLALTISLLAGAAAAVPVGRWLDRRGGRGLMTVGALLAALLVLAWSRVDTLAELYVVWIGIGISSAAVLYEAAFAVVVSAFRGTARGRALLAVTVVAGFASSIFLPASGWLLAAFGWRTAVLVLGLVYGVVAVPLHLVLPVRADRGEVGQGRSKHAESVAAAHRRVVVRRALRDPVFYLLGAGFFAQGAAVAVVGVLLVSALRSLGHPASFAAGAAGMLGVMSVSGRLAFTAAGRRGSPAYAAAAVFALQAFGAGLLPVLGRSDAGAIGCVVVFGAGFGVATITRPALLAERYGTGAYATISGTMSTPLTIAKALAPLGGAVLAVATGSYTPVMSATAGACLLGSVALAVAAYVVPRLALPENAGADVGAAGAAAVAR